MPPKTNTRTSPRKREDAASTSSSTDEAGTKGENTIDEILLQQFEPTRASSSKVAELDEAFKMEPVTEDVTKLFNCLVDLLPTEGRNATTSREINAARKEKVRVRVRVRNKNPNIKVTPTLFSFFQMFYLYNKSYIVQISTFRRNDKKKNYEKKLNIH